MKFIITSFNEKQNGSVPFRCGISDDSWRRTSIFFQYGESRREQQAPRATL